MKYAGVGLPWYLHYLQEDNSGVSLLLCLVSAAVVQPFQCYIGPASALL